MKRKYRKWTQSEESRLVKQIKVFPQNLNKCFIIVGEEIGRSPRAVSAHWYTKLSKRPDVEVLFGLVTPKSFSKNRKGGTGVPHPINVFKKILKLLGF